jgi:GDP/UDP-N,N'-diacetylbacillosamine 2-epimerase (hydrolysing)
MKKICVITGSRSEYGLLKNIIQKIKNSKKLQLQLIVTGSHLSKEFGRTIDFIKKDNFFINKKFKIFNKLNKEHEVSQAISLAITKFSSCYSQLNPDIILILGDRYEIFSAAIAALFKKIPVAHLHGGERSEGAYDDSMRHAITKLSHLHFVSAKIYKKRVIQMGENPKKVFLTGSVGVTSIKKLDFLKKNQLEKKLNLKFCNKNFFIIFHPVTLEDKTYKTQMNEIAHALKNYKDFGKFFVYPSADLGGSSIIKIIKRFVEKNPNSYCFSSLDQAEYFSMVKNCNIVIGNSSSGVIEVPSLRVAVLNIGNRQDGRLKSKAIINCPPKRSIIIKNIEKLLTPMMRKKIKKIKNPYDNGDAPQKIVNILEKIKIKNLIRKNFKDII